MRKFLLIILFMYTFGFGGNFTPHLDKYEYRFKESIYYRLKDFRFAWDVSYVTVVSFIKIHQENQKVVYSDLHTLFQTDNRVLDNKEKEGMVYLTNLMSGRDDYGIKEGYGPWGYRYFLIVYIDREGRMFALETLNELKEMLGRIDNAAKLHLWLLLKYHDRPYSYLLMYNNTWRVRYSGWDLGECYYREWMKYYTQEGNFVKQKHIRSYHKKGCVEILE